MKWHKNPRSTYFITLHNIIYYKDGNCIQWYLSLTQKMSEKLCSEPKNHIDAVWTVIIVFIVISYYL